MNTQKQRDLLTCDWETAEAPPRLKVLCLSDSSCGRNDNGVENEAILEALDLANHLGLVILRAVVVDHTKTTQQRNMYRHVVFGDRVHGRGHKGSLEGDALRDRGIKIDINGGEA
jgi:hypothetical protein